jgi:hypothetical protein
MLRVLVCGGRDYKNKDWVYEVLDEINDEIALIITGAAEGADTFGLDWAFDRNVKWKAFTPFWHRDGKMRAPIIRNQRMIDEGKPDLVIAFPGGNGTEDMVSKTKKARIPMIDLRDGE